MTTTIYKVGQLAYSSTFNYYTNIDNITVEYRDAGTDGKDAILKTNGNFKANQTYYMTFDAYVTNSNTDIGSCTAVIKLVNDSSTEITDYEYQYVHTIKHLSSLSTNYAFSFTPITDFAYILVEIQRNVAEQSYKVIISSPVLKSMNEIIGAAGGIPTASSPIIHIGAWGKPQTLLFINHQQISIGPRAYYELEDFEIDSLSILPYSWQGDSKIEYDNFSIDYEWAEEVGDE